MIAPISASRRDGQSSFNKLSVYLLYGNRGQEVLRGEVVLSDNILSMDTVDIEMAAVARENVRVSDPIFHYQLAWTPGERPTKEQWVSAAKKSVRDLGFESHQHLLVGHDDKDHFHVHVMLNRIHPETYRAIYPKFSMRTLDKCCREVEHEQGWEESPGLYRWDPTQGIAVRNTPEEMEQHRSEVARISAQGRASKIEAHRNVKTLQAYIRSGVAKELNGLLEQAKCTWPDVHSLLHSHGLEIEKAGRGGYTVHAIGTEIRVKASDVFRRAFSGTANRAATEQKLGSWQPAGEALQATARPRYSPLARDSGRREEQRLQREKDRRELRSEYRAYTSAQRQELRNHHAGVRSQRKSLGDGLKAKKREIRSQHPARSERKAAESIAVAEAVVERQLLAVRSLRQRLLLEPMSYSDWVAHKAEKGDKRAVSQLRGWKYRDKKKARSVSEYAAIEPGAIHFGPADDSGDNDWTRLTRLKQLQEDEELAKTIAATRWALNRKNGDVTYFVKGKAAIVDRGRILSVLDSEEKTIVFALEMAVMKFGTVITAEGSNEWKLKVAIAAARGHVLVRFADPYMQDIMEQEKKRVDRLRAQADTLSGVRSALLRKAANELPLRDHTEAHTILNAVFGGTRGSCYLDDLVKDFDHCEHARDIRGVFQLVVQRRARGGEIRYAVRVIPGKEPEFAAMLEKAERQIKLQAERIPKPKEFRQREQPKREKVLELGF